MHVLISGLPEKEDFLCFFETKGLSTPLKRVSIALVQKLVAWRSMPAPYETIERLNKQTAFLASCIPSS
jgi:hypothetical protein